MSTTVTQTTTGELAALAAIERRVLWLAVRIVDYANRERPKRRRAEGRRPPGVVGLDGDADDRAVASRTWTRRDRVSVKPHASPVLHAIEYLLGRLDRSLPDAAARLRRPPVATRRARRTRTRSTTRPARSGSARPRRCSERSPTATSPTHFGASTGGRFISLLGDAELDEGNLWEAVAEPLTRGLGNALWIVDLNRQSLDRVIPGHQGGRARGALPSRAAGT